MLCPLVPPSRYAETLTVLERFETEDGAGQTRVGAMTLDKTRQTIATGQLGQDAEKMDDELKKRKQRGEKEMRKTLHLLETQGKPKFANLAIELECPRMLVDEIRASGVENLKRRVRRVFLGAVFDNLRPDHAESTVSPEMWEILLAPRLQKICPSQDFM